MIGLVDEDFLRMECARKKIKFDHNRTLSRKVCKYL